jgi:hypothetical protein
LLGLFLWNKKGKKVVYGTVAVTVNTDELKALPKDQIPAVAKTLPESDIQLLVETLSETEDKLRYNAFLLLQAHSQEQPFVYAYWDVLENKLESENSYQRSIGLMLIAENVRWDKEGKFAKVLSKYMACCNDEKFITARQTIQGLETIVKATDKYNDAIKQALTNLQFSQYKENQQKLLKKDAANVLKAIADK